LPSSQCDIYCSGSRGFGMYGIRYMTNFEPHSPDPRILRQIIIRRTQLNFCASLRASRQGRDPVQIIETRAVSLQAPQDVRLTAGLTLPPGLYQGTEERIRTDSIAAPSWAINDKIALKKEQLRINPNLRLVHSNVDVTEFVRQGRLIRGPEK